MGDQAQKGVIDPDPKVLRVGATGVGMRVVMKDKEGKELLALVLGKEVPDRPGLRYVRKVGENAIRVVAVKTDKLSTKFHDWIERNLLQLNVFDLKRLWIHDYYVEVSPSTQQLNQVQRGEMCVDYDDNAASHWKLTEDRQFTGKDWTPVKMASNEELNTAKLDELLTALGDLKIIDVSRKSASLTRRLKASKQELTQHQNALAAKGFFVATPEDADDKVADVFSNEGEIRVQMKDGVEYILRFGALAGGTGAAEKAADKRQGKQAGPDDNEESRLNRYLFIMARFDPDAIAKPKLEPLPDLPKADLPKTDDKKPAAEKPIDKTAARTKSPARRPSRPSRVEETGRPGGRGRTPTHRAGRQAAARRIPTRNRRRQETGCRAERPIRRLVLCHLRQRISENPFDAGRRRREETEAQGRQGGARSPRSDGRIAGNGAADVARRGFEKTKIGQSTIMSPDLTQFFGIPSAGPDGTDILLLPLPVERTVSYHQARAAVLGRLSKPAFKSKRSTKKHWSSLPTGRGFACCRRSIPAAKSRIVCERSKITFGPCRPGAAENGVNQPLRLVEDGQTIDVVPLEHLTAVITAVPLLVAHVPRVGDSRQIGIGDVDRCASRCSPAHRSDPICSGDGGWPAVRCRCCWLLFVFLADPSISRVGVQLFRSGRISRAR